MSFFRQNQYTQKLFSHNAFKDLKANHTIHKFWSVPDHKQDKTSLQDHSSLLSYRPLKLEAKTIFASI